MANNHGFSGSLAENLALDLSQATLDLHRAARISENQVYQALGKLLQDRGCLGAIFLLVEPYGSMQLGDLIIPSHSGDGFRPLDQTKSNNPVLRWDCEAYYSLAITQRRSVFVDSAAELLHTLLPTNPHPAVRKAGQQFAGRPAMLLPVFQAGELHALLLLSAADLRMDDLPVWQTTADQFGEALETARLLDLAGRSYSVIMQPDRRQNVGPAVDYRAEEEADSFGSNQRGMQALLEAIPDAVIFKDSLGRWIYINPIASRLFQLDGLAWQGKTDLELAELRPEIRDVLHVCYRSDQAAWESGGRYDLIEKMPNPDGSEQVHDVHKVPVFDAAGRRLGLVIIGRDITDYVNLEQSLRSRAEELAELQALSADIISEHNISMLLSRVVERAMRLLKSSAGSLYICDHSRQVVKLVVELPAVPEGYIGIELKYGEGAAGKVAVTNEPLIIDDYRSWEHRSPVYERDQLYSAVLSVPLVWQGQVIGVLQVMDRVEVRTFNQRDQELLGLFANQAAGAIENARLYEAAGKRAAELEVLRQASLSLTSSLDLVDVLDAILKSVLSLLPGMRNAHIFLYDERQQRLAFGAALNADGKRGEMLAEPRPQGLTYTVARSGESIQVSDMHTSPLYQGAPSDWHGAIAGLPLKIGNRVVGVMNISYDQPRDFPDNEMRLLRLLADQAAIAIENAGLFEQAATERRHLRLLYDVARAVSASLDPEIIFDRAVELTCRAFGGVVAQGFIYQPEDETLRMCAIHGRPDVSLDTLEQKLTVSLDTGLAGWVARFRQAAYVDDVNQDERWFYIEEVDREICAALTVPILLDDRLLGVISVLHRQTGAFNQGHVELMNAVCQEIGLALMNADRYQQTQRRLTEISLIQKLAQKFSQRLELQELLNEVVTRLAHTFAYPQVRISLIEDDYLVLKAVHGPAPSIRRISLDKGISGLAARTGEMVYVPDVTQEPNFIACVPGTAAALAVPIFLGRSVIGVINIETDGSLKLDVQDRNLLKLLSDQISIAIENAVLYDRVRQHAQELEQTVARRTQELSELYELNQAISNTTSYDALLRLLLEHLQGAMHGCLVMGSLRSDTGWISYIFPAIHTEASDLENIQRYWRSCLKMISGGMPPPDQDELVVLQPPPGGHDSQSLRPDACVHTIIGMHEEPAGVLIVAGAEDWLANPEQRRLLDTFALQAAAAVQRISTVRAEEHRRLEGMVEHLPVGVCLLDQDMRLLLANPLGRTYLALLNGEGEPTLIDRLGSVQVDELISGRDDPLPVDIAHTGQHRMTFEVLVRSMKPASNQWLITLRDVTQEREAQLRIQMQERLATVGQLAAGIAHDFNNIMAAILVYADLLLHDEGLGQASRERIAIIQQQVHRAASLIRQILDFSRRAVMEQNALDLMPFIKELEKMLGRVMPETIRLKLKCAPGDYWVNADPSRLQQVFINLALNSRDAMPQGGTLSFEMDSVEIAAKEAPPLPELQPGWWVRVVVGDTGSGIPENVLPHIFEPFFTTKPVGQGTGLGLAQVYGIIKQHGGHIDVSSTPGQGATFTIYLPKLIQAQPAIRPVDAPLLRDGSGKRVLLVEDNPETLEALRTLLEAHNYQVIVADNGARALELIRQERMKIDMLVSDIVMPEMGGLALYQALKRVRPDLQVLFVTGHPLDAASQDLLEKGDIVWLQKPFSVREFIAMVQRLLDNAGAEVCA